MRYAFVRHTAVSACMLAAALTAGQGTPVAQGRSQTPPDIVGLRMGMGLQEVYNVLKAHDPRIARVEVDEIAWPQLGPKPFPHVLRIPPKDPNVYACEAVEAQVTLPPSKQVVWSVGRQLMFQEQPGCGKETALDNVLAALREKYGPESSAFPVYGQYYWIFDEQGQRVAGRPPDQCSSFTGLAWGRNYDPRLMPPQEACRFVIVHALVQRGATPALVKNLQVTMISPSVGVTAAFASKALSASVDAAAEKRRLDEAAKQGKPKL